MRHKIYPDVFVEEGVAIRAIKRVYAEKSGDLNHKFEPKDIIEYNGQKYIIAGQNTQDDGVTGITPKAGQHAEYRLEWAQYNV